MKSWNLFEIPNYFNSIFSSFFVFVELFNLKQDILFEFRNIIKLISLAIKRQD